MERLEAEARRKKEPTQPTPAAGRPKKRGACPRKASAVSAALRKVDSASEPSEVISFALHLRACRPEDAALHVELAKALHDKGRLHGSAGGHAKELYTEAAAAMTEGLNLDDSLSTLEHNLMLAEAQWESGDQQSRALSCETLEHLRRTVVEQGLADQLADEQIAALVTPHISRHVAIGRLELATDAAKLGEALDLDELPKSQRNRLRSALAELAEATRAARATAATAEIASPETARPLPAELQAAVVPASLPTSFEVVDLNGVKVLVVDLPHDLGLEHWQALANATFYTRAVSAFPGNVSHLSPAMGYFDFLIASVGPLVARELGVTLRKQGAQGFLQFICRDEGDPPMVESQYEPHVDSNDPSHGLAIVHYLADEELWPFGGGTGLFRHSRTGLQLLSRDGCLRASVAAEGHDSAIGRSCRRFLGEGPVPKCANSSRSFITAARPAPEYELLHVVPFRPSRLAIYPTNQLHAGYFTERGVEHLSCSPDARYRRAALSSVWYGLE
eukprot:3772785-Prymnesium_polylepis.1